jgi:preprotein translocase subunit Sss1
MEAETEEKFKKLEEKIKKSEGINKEDVVKQFATREKLERDFKEDKIIVTFNSSPETRRSVLARKPNQKEFIDILDLSVQASRFSGKGDIESLEKLKTIYSNLNKIAAGLCIDKSLNAEFWQSSVSFATLQNFISELINASQQPSGGITESDLKSFR